MLTMGRPQLDPRQEPETQRGAAGQERGRRLGASASLACSSVGRTWFRFMDGVRLKPGLESSDQQETVVDKRDLLEEDPPPPLSSNHPQVSSRSFLPLFYLVLSSPVPSRPTVQEDISHGPLALSRPASPPEPQTAALTPSRPPGLTLPL